MKPPNIRVAVSDPTLKDKIKIDISGPLVTVHWLIRFNMPLNEETVNDKNMQVTDTEGYIMRTDISYKDDSNQIVITPLDSYEDQRFYLLKVSNKVCSKKGQSLKSAINILFKLYKGDIKEYRTIKEDVPVPLSQLRPIDYDERQKHRVLNYLDNYTENIDKRIKMTPENVGINPVLGILGILMVLWGFAVLSTALIVTAALISMAGAAHIFAQWQSKVFRAKIQYNKGVRFFNRMQYQEAKEAFSKALEINPNNELAKYGMVRVGIYK